MTDISHTIPAFSVVEMPENVDDLPAPENPYYVRGKRTYLYKRTHFGNAMTEVPDIPGLHDLPNNQKGLLYYDFDTNPIPPQMIGQAWHFFRYIWNRHKTEAMLDLVYDPDQEARAARTPRQGFDDNGYRFFVPKQHVSGGSVQAERVAEHYKRGTRLVGTIHSHCNFSAFHSGTDTHDADGHDGLHITIGFVDKNPPQYAAMVSVDKVRWNFDLKKIVPDPIPFTPHPKWWERYVDTRPAPRKVTPAKAINQFGSNYKPTGNAANKPNGKTTHNPYRQYSWLDDDRDDPTPAKITGSKIYFDSLEDAGESMEMWAINNEEISLLRTTIADFHSLLDDLAAFGLIPATDRWVFDYDMIADSIWSTKGGDAAMPSEKP